jgi:hypothetical protein
LVFECKEGASHRLQSVRLYDGPFFYNFSVLLIIEVEAYFMFLIDCLVEEGDFLYIQFVFAVVLVFSRREHATVLHRVYQVV